ncbi:MAG: iron-sulfur cluster-binding domain-containing protein [Treponema sp.]|nr:iron-sulfur cluster-binding domain-containing protein [Candidatus Treponema caballi]
MANVKVKLIGAFDMLKFKNMAKNREKKIQAAPANDIVCDYKINNLAKALHPDKVNLVIDEVIDQTKCGAKTFVFKNAENGPLPYFRAGQYISLKLKIGDSFVTRPYSLSSGPKEALEGKYRLTIKANPEGFAADWILGNCKAGDKIEASAPQGNFFYDKYRDAKNVIALAGGSGITPFLSMAQAIRDGVEDFNLTLIFGNRTEEVILFKKELDEITKVCPKVKVVHVLSDEEKEGYEHGFITAELVKKYAPDNYSIFICGPEAMYRFAKKEIEKLNLPRRLVRAEMMGVTKKVYDNPDFPKDAVGKTFELTIKQGPVEYKIKADSAESILVAVERAGIKAPSRCRSGECGWCRSRVISGNYFAPKENEGRRWADIEYGYIHPCSSFPVSDMVIEVPGEY